MVKFRGLGVGEILAAPGAPVLLLCQLGFVPTDRNPGQVRVSSAPPRTISQQSCSSLWGSCPSPVVLIRTLLPLGVPGALRLSQRSLSGIAALSPLGVVSPLLSPLLSLSLSPFRVMAPLISCPSPFRRPLLCAHTVGANAPAGDVWKFDLTAFRARAISTVTSALGAVPRVDAVATNPSGRTVPRFALAAIRARVATLCPFRIRESTRLNILLSSLRVVAVATNPALRLASALRRI